MREILVKDELKEVSSGSWGYNWGDVYFRPDGCGRTHSLDPDQNNCTYQWKRNIYIPKYDNCAATVEDGSWCGDNDACFSGSWNEGLLQSVGMKHVLPEN